MTKRRVAFLITALMSGSALAQGTPGDARFCQSYAANASGMSGLAIKKNPACLDYGKGVHDNFKMHNDWCIENPASSVKGAEANIRRLVALCTGNAPPPVPASAVGKPSDTPAINKYKSKAVGRIGDFQMLRFFDSTNNAFQSCSARIVSSGREVHFYQHAGDGFGLYFRGPQNISGQVVSISVPQAGSNSYDAVPLGGGWYKAQLDNGVVNSLRKAPEYMEVEFANTKTTYMLSRQYMPDVFKSISDCRKRG